MKKLLVLFVVLINSINMFASGNEKLFGTYSQNTFSVSLNEESKVLVFDKFKEYFNYNGRFTSASIDDPQPLNSESYAYAIFDGNNLTDNKWLSVYFKLNKEINTNDGTVRYYVDFSKKDYASREDSGGGSCTGVGCSSCHKDRNWFLGPVIGCSCNTPAVPNGFCNHGTTAGPGWFEILMFLIGFL